MKNPWDRGWIPKPGHKSGDALVQAPKGWVRVTRGDGVWMFERGGETLWSRDMILGRCGEPWKLWLNHNTGVLRAPDMQMRSLKALVAWYEIETADRPKPEPFDWSKTPTGRRAAKAAALGARYGMGAKRMTELMGTWCGAPQNLPKNGDIHSQLVPGDHRLDAIVYGTAGTIVAVDEAGVLDIKSGDFTKLEERACKTFLRR